MRNEILAMILVLLVPWELNRRNTVIQSPEVHHVDQEEGEGIVEPTQKPADIPLIFKILYPWVVPRDLVTGVSQTPTEDPRNVIVGAPDTRMEEKEEIVKTKPQPAKIPLIFRILYPWAVPRNFIRGVPVTPMEEENTKRAEQPVEETLRGIENDRPEPISWFSFLTRPPFWFSWALLICVLILKYILRQNYLARILGCYLMFLQLSGCVYLLIDIWNRWGPAFENIILPLYINGGDWYHRVVTGLWAVWSKGCVALENTVPPWLIVLVTEHRLECFLGVIIILVSVLLGYFEPICQFFQPTSSYITPPTSENVESTMEDHISAYQSDFCRPVKKRRQTNYLRRMKRSKPRNIIFLQKPAVIPLGDDTIPPTREVTLPANATIIPPTRDVTLPANATIIPPTRDVTLPANAAIIPPTSKNGESAMEVTGSPIPRVNCSEILPTTPVMDSGLSPQWRTVIVHPRVARHRKNVDSSMEETELPIPSVTPPQAFHSASLSQHIEKLIVPPRVACRGKNVDSSMEETVPIPSVTPPGASLRAKLSRHIGKLKSKMVIGKIFPRKSDITPPSNIIPPTSKNAASAMEETDAPIPSIAPTMNNSKPRSDESLPTNYRTPAMNSGLSPQWRTVIVHPRVARRRETVDSSMEETDVPMPSVTSPRGLSNVAPQNGGRLSLPSSLMSPVTDDLNMLLDSSISQQRATLAVVPNVETRSNQTRLHLRELFRLVKKRKATKEDRQES